jgi:hypothetical protein
MSVTPPEESGINQTQVINIKQAQQERHDITILKNHEKKWLKIRPSQQPQSYGDNSVLEFNLKGQGVDYVNLNGSSMYIALSLTGVGANVPATAFMSFGACGLFKRFQLRSGVFDVEDINQWGKFMYWQIMHPSKDGFHDIKARMFQVDNVGMAITTDGAVVVLKVPFATCLDNGGYFPVYNLAEELRLRWTLDNGNNNFANIAGDCTYTFTISDAYMMVDGLTATSGAILNDVPYKFKTFTTLGFKNSVVNGNAARIDKFSYDVKKTSLKKFFGGYNQNLGIGVGFIANYYRSLLMEDVNSYTFSMGGINYPFQNGVENKFLGFQQWMKYFHRQDCSLITENFWVDFEHFASYNENNYSQSGAVTASFDRLDQMSSVISGIDSERYPVQLNINRGAIGAQSLSFYAYFTFDIIISIIGGEIKKED